MAKASFNIDARRTRLLTGPVNRVLYELSWPMTLGLFSVIIINVTDTFYIGKLGADELAAIGFCFPVIFGMSAISIGMGNGGAAIVSRAIGAGHEEQAKALISSTLLFVTGFAIVLAIIMLRVSDGVFRTLGAPEELLPYINQFMTVWYLGLPLLVAPIVLNGLIRAVGEAKVPSILMVVAAAINAVISPFIIFGLLGMPALGMKGAAIATITARLFITVYAIVWLLRAELMSFSKAALRSFIPCTTQVLRYGAPAFFAQLASPIASATATRLLAGAGPETVAGFAVGARIESLALIPFFALQTGITPFIGQNVGAGNNARLRQSERSVWAFALLWGGIGGAILFGFGESLAFLFTDKPEIAATSDAYLNRLAFGFWGSGLLIISIGTLNPLGYPNLAFAANALRFIVLYGGASAMAVLLFGVAAETAVFTAASLSFALAGLAAAAAVAFLLEKPNRKGLESDAPQPEAVPRKI